MFYLIKERLLGCDLYLQGGLYSEGALIHVCLLVWSLKTSGLYLEVTMFYLIKERLLKCNLYLQGGLYSEGVFNTGLIVYALKNLCISFQYSVHLFSLISCIRDNMR